MGSPLMLFMLHSGTFVPTETDPFLFVGDILSQTLLLHFIQEELGMEGLFCDSVGAACSLGILFFPSSRDHKITMV